MTASTTPADGNAPSSAVPGDPTHRALPVGALGRVLIVLFGLTAAGSVVAAWMNFQALQFPGGVSAGVLGEEVGLVVALLLFGGQLALAVVLPITFLAWMDRAYSNLTAFGYQRRFDLGWAIGGWFVPIMNIFRPFQIMREIHALSGLDRRPVADAALRATPTMVAWWVTWFAMWALPQFVETWDVDAAAEGSAHIVAQVVRYALAASCALLALPVVHAVTTRQTATIQRLSRDAGPGAV